VSTVLTITSNEKEKILGEYAESLRIAFELTSFKRGVLKLPSRGSLKLTGPATGLAAPIDIDTDSAKRERVPRSEKPQKASPTGITFDLSFNDSPAGVPDEVVKAPRRRTFNKEGQL
jgi:hypothetical protein